MMAHYSFGEIRVAGKTYRSDIIIFPDGRVQSSWWRKEGHSLCREDILELIAAEPEKIVIGKGKTGRMEPEPELIDYLEKKGIAVDAWPSAEAVQRYNEAVADHKVGACFHLTC